MGCLFASVVIAFSRFTTLLIWMARPSLFSNAFGGSWLWPLLGTFLLSCTALMYVLLWLAPALLIDISGWASTAYTNRDRVPNYVRA